MQNLVKLFPDATKDHRAKLKTKQQRYYNKTHIDKFPNEGNAKLEKFYDSEFRKWHYKLFFIILGCCVVIYFLLAKAPGFIRLIVS